VRAPNVPTAVADVVAGGALAAIPLSSPASWIPALGSAALYAGGVALNDAFDLDKDKRLHPDRVLPSGLVGIGAARAGGFLLLLAGVASGMAQGPRGVAAAAALACAILVYDVLPDRAGVLGAVVLGSCRGLNLLRGGLDATPFPDDLVLYAALHGVLVGLLTVVSLGEDQAGGPRLVRAAVTLLPFAYAGPAVAAYRAGHHGWSVALLVLSAELALWVVRPAHRSPPKEALVVPRGVFTLSLVGALYCLAVMEWAGAAVLAAFFPLSRLLARALAQRGS
jgi:UbiA prenyltransferase family protein